MHGSIGHTTGWRFRHAVRAFSYTALIAHLTHILACFCLCAGTLWTYVWFFPWRSARICTVRAVYRAYSPLLSHRLSADALGAAAYLHSATRSALQSAAATHYSHHYSAAIPATHHLSAAYSSLSYPPACDLDGTIPAPLSSCLSRAPPFTAALHLPPLSPSACHAGGFAALVADGSIAAGRISLKRGTSYYTRPYAHVRTTSSSSWRIPVIRCLTNVFTAAPQLKAALPALHWRTRTTRTRPPHTYLCYHTPHTPCTLPFRCLRTRRRTAHARAHCRTKPASGGGSHCTPPAPPPPPPRLIY